MMCISLHFEMGAPSYLWSLNYTHPLSCGRIWISSLLSMHGMLIPASMTFYLFSSITGKQPPHSHLCSYLNSSHSPTLSIIPSSGYCLTRGNVLTLTATSPFSPLPDILTLRDDLAVTFVVHSFTPSSKLLLTTYYMPRIVIGSKAQWWARQMYIYPHRTYSLVKDTDISNCT